MDAAFQKEGGLVSEQRSIDSREGCVRGLRVNAQDEVAIEREVAGAQEEKREPVADDFYERLEGLREEFCSGGILSGFILGRGEQAKQSFQPEHADWKQDKEDVVHPEAERVEQSGGQKQDQEGAGNG